MVTLVIGYVLIALFYIVEGRLRSDPSARSMEQGEYDRRSTQWVGLALSLTVLALLAALPLNLLNIGHILAPAAGWIGVIAAVGGLAVRIWAMQTLGRFYSRTLRLANDQAIVQTGPYKMLRHPGYLGTILLFVGAALGTMNWIAFVLALAVMLAAYLNRIQVEEQMLLNTYGEQYREYRSHTWRLIPFLF